jgi:5'-3' exonuclease
MNCNLLVDTNYVLYKNAYLLRRTLYGDLLPSLEAYFEKMMKLYPFDNIFLISDTRTSWRSRFHPTYKGSRSKDDKIDWEFVFNTYNQFKDIMREHPRVKVLESDGVEGDDWISTIIKASNRNNKSTITIASDADLQQLLDYRTNPKWINMIWRDNFTNPKLYLPKGYKLFLHELEKDGGDLFNINENMAFINMYKNIITTTPIDEVNKEQLLFEKIIKGDKSDNIPSVLLKKGKTGKYSGIGDSGATKIYESYKGEYPRDIDFDKNDWVDEVVDIVADYKKVDKTDFVQDSIKKNIHSNIRLVQLHWKHLPPDIMDAIKEGLK